MAGEAFWLPLPSDVPDADDVSYDPSASGLTATDVQAAIDELVGDSSSPGGGHVHLLRDSAQTIPAGGATLSFTDEWSTHSRSNVVAPVLPVEEIEIEVAGYYNASLSLELADDVGGDVTMHRTRDGGRSVVWGPLRDPGWTATAGTRFSGVAEAIELQGGDTVSFDYDHGGGSSHDVDKALLTLYLVDVAPAADVELLAAYNGAGTSGVYSIGLSTADVDGVAWTAHPSNPILSATSGWESTHVKEPSLAVDDTGTIHMFYAGHNGTGWQIGHATLSDSLVATRDGGNPVIPFGGSGGFDESGCAFPAVVYDLDETDPTRRWKLWYGGLNASGVWTIGYAYAASASGPWTKHGQVLNIGTAGQFDDVWVLPGTAVKDGGTWTLLYAGMPEASGNLRGWQPGAATFTDPEGTYTKSGSNPIFARRTTAAKALTADLTAGQTTVTVADTSVFEVGEAVVIDSNTVADKWALPYIVSIDSSTQMTISFGLGSGSLTVAEGGFVRSLFYGSLFPRSVQRTASGWRIYGTAFQFASTDELAEAGVVWTATTLTTGWAEDVTVTPGIASAQGFMFPFGSSAGWSGRSAENPSVVERLV